MIINIHGPYTPEYATPGSSGMDLLAWFKDDQEEFTISPGERAIIPSGIYLEIPIGYEGQVRPRSGNAFKKGITVLNSPGTIDSDYRGEIGVILINHGNCNQIIKKGDKIAQLVICPVAHAGSIHLHHKESVEELSNTNRGSGGFGHTGDSVKL